MKEVRIECAGAGKTYGIAQKIADILDDCPEGKKLYAITHTNYAVRQITEELQNAIRYIPDCVVIKTIHSFLLDNLVYPFSKFVKEEPISSCSIQELPQNIQWKAKRKRELKDEGIIHTDDVYQYSKSLLVTTKADKVAVRKRKEIALDYFVSDIYCLFVDESQDMDEWFFKLMLCIIRKLENYYFVGDPFQALWAADEYKAFTRCVMEQEGIVPEINFVSRRIPICLVPICNRIMPKEFMLSSISTEIGKIEYLMLSDINNEVRKKLASNNIFSYTKNKTDVFSTSSNRAGLTSEFMRILNLKYPEYNPDALYRAATVKILEEGVDSYLRRTKIELSDRDYSELANQFCRKKERGIFVEAIHKIKGMEGDTACFIICNSLLEVLLGVKNDYNRETNLLYVALTRTKRRLLLIVDDNQGLIENFEKQKIDIHTGMKELDIIKAEIGDWF